MSVCGDRRASRQEDPPVKLSPPAATSWHDPVAYWRGLSAATAGLDAPYGVLSLPALAHNAHDLVRRAAGRPIRVASKSLRVRSVIEAVLGLPGYAGVLSYTLPEALWLAETIDDIVVGYPTVDRAAIHTLATTPVMASRITLMVDSIEQLDFIDSIVDPSHRECLRLCLELDAAWESRILGRVGVFRSPVRTTEQARAFAVAVAARPGFRLVGIMAYEAQIAGVPNRPPKRSGLARAIDYMQKNSTIELRQRRGSVVDAVRSVVPLEFVNGGGTGSLELTAEDPAVTEVAAGSGLFGPHLFDNYAHFSPAPAAAFALSVVRKPNPRMATLLGGGWIASGPPAIDRLPQLAWPPGLEFIDRESAGEVQSPLGGPGAHALAIGDIVWLRHTKAGEISEHLKHFALVDGDSIIDSVPTYRGEGKAFL
jgi:D-serine deaminase-like pyridoxal phosphate-dependent protein